jgi:hypothetical protein
MRGGQRHATAAFAAISAVFVYTTVANIIERPDGVKIAACFIAAILVVSFLSRAIRTFELRVSSVQLDATAQRIVDDFDPEPVRLIANEPDRGDEAEYRAKAEQERHDQCIPDPDHVAFVEVVLSDPSEFETELFVVGEERYGYRILRASSPSVPNAIAALLLHIRDITGRPPHVYFDWDEGNPARNLLRYLLVGVGEVAPVTREILREAEPDRARRPRVHVV